MKNKLDFIALQTASEAFATERLPDSWLDMSEEDQQEWLDDHKWYPLENYNNDEFFSLISDHSLTVRSVMHEQ